MKYAFIFRNKKRWPVSLLCDVLGVSVSGYHQHQQRTRRPATKRSLSDDALLVQIRAVHAEVKGEYGWPRMHKSLRNQDIRVGKERVQRLMQQHGIRARHKRKWVVTTDSKHTLPVAANLLARDFTPAEPDQAWTSDITYIGTAEGWQYLAVIIDLFSRQIVGWSIESHMKAELVTDALRMAWFRRRPAAGLIMHSDRGSQYCSHLFQDALKAFGMRSSMSRKANCWDNAPTESLWSSLKIARIHGREFKSAREAKTEVMDWIHFYNARRLHSTLNYVSPMQFEKNWLARRAFEKMTA